MFCTYNKTQLPPAFPDKPPRPTRKSEPDSYGVPSFFVDIVHMKPCVLPPRVESVSCAQALMAFNARCSGGFFSQCQTPRLGNLMWGSEFSFLWESLCDTVIFQSVGCLPGRYGVACIMKVPLLPSRCGFLSFGIGYIFFSFFCSFHSIFLMVFQHLA